VTNYLMLTLPRALSSFDWLSFRLPAYSGIGRWVYFAYLAPMLLAAVGVRRWRPFDLKRSSPLGNRSLSIATAAACVALAAIVVLHPFSKARPDGRLHVDILDVGQGDAALITFPTGETMLVDGGGRMDYRSDGDETSEPFEPDRRSIGESVVSEVLWAKGLSRVDYVAATHADADHIQGLTDVVRSFRVGVVLFGRMPADDPDLAELYSEMLRRGVPGDVAARGDVLQIGDARVEVLWPPPAERGASANDDSIVLRVVFGSRAILLTGDTEREAEAGLLNSGGTLAADVVKVPHHGSRTSSTTEFVEAAGTRYAVISVGRRSPFGHPHPEVVERWRASGADLLTTGVSGMISISTDGRDMRLEQFVRAGK
jgi:competence protein ComEC